MPTSSQILTCSAVLPRGYACIFGPLCATGYLTEQWSNYVTHLNRHLGLTPHHCKEYIPSVGRCPSKFADPAQLIKHRTRHHGHRPSPRNEGTAGSKHRMGSAKASSSSTTRHSSSARYAPYGYARSHGTPQHTLPNAVEYSPVYGEWTGPWPSEYPVAGPSSVQNMPLAFAQQPCASPYEYDYSYDSPSDASATSTSSGSSRGSSPYSVASYPSPSSSDTTCSRANSSSPVPWSSPDVPSEGIDARFLSWVSETFDDDIWSLLQHALSV